MEALLTEIRADLGPDVAVAAVDPRDAPPPSPPEEAADVGRAVDKRRREYAWGRWAAREALAALGGPRDPLPRRNDRRPEWPPGFTGSISHCDDVCAALVARTSAYAAVGLDVERAGALDDELVSVVMTSRERARLGDDGRTAKHVFVVKEAYYKAQFEKTQTLLEFVDVELEPLDEGRFRARCARTGIAPLDVRLAAFGPHLWAWVGSPRD